jgi:predicted NUDIX family NTP pyrophosphohydrolase
MKKQSAGLLLYRITDAGPQVFLVHPGGPFWKNKDEGAWSIPKGEFTDDEDGLAAARREFTEETGFHAQGKFIPLEPCRQRSGKMVHAWLLNQDVEASEIRSNTFALQWPPRSGRTINVPEVDRAGWFSLDEAEKRINPGQLPLLAQCRSLILT